MKTFIIFFVIWLTLSAVGYGIGQFVFSPTRLEYMTKDGEGIYGRVVAKEEENHGIIRYSYNVGGTEHTGAGFSRNGNPDFDDIQIGDRVIVYYDPANPERSMMGYPRNDLEGQYSGILFLTVVFPVFPMILILAIYFGIRTSKRTKAG